MTRSDSILSISCISVSLITGAAPCPAEGRHSTPPTPEAIRDEFVAMRALMDGLLIEYKTDEAGFKDQSMTSTTEKHADTTWELRDGCALLSTLEFTGPRTAPRRQIGSARTCFDGTDTFRIGPFNTSRSLTVLVVKPGLDPLFDNRAYFNYATLVWSGLHLSLDDMMNSGTFTSCVASEPVEVGGCPTWCLTLRHNTLDDSEEAATIHEFWVAPSMGMIPVRTRISSLLRDGTSRLINGTKSSDFEEVRPGLFLPRTVTITDPFDPNPVTYKRFSVARFGQSRPAAELTADTFAGDRYVFDYRYNQQYELRNGVRSNTMNLSSVTELEGKLRKYVAEADAVREASQKSAPSTPSWSFGRISAWSIPVFAGLGILLWSFRAGRVRA